MIFEIKYAFSFRRNASRDVVNMIYSSGRPFHILEPAVIEKWLKWTMADDDGMVWRTDIKKTKTCGRRLETISRRHISIIAK